MVVKVFSEEDKARWRSQKKDWEYHPVDQGELKYHPELLQLVRGRWSCSKITWDQCSRAVKYEMVCDYLLELLTGRE